MNLIFFDLFPDGDQVLEVISRYDDLLALEGRDDYDPGDKLALIIPFLIHHGVTEEDIRGLAERAAIVAGARELIMSLNHWQVYCISTSYEQYANRIMQRVGIAPENLACTRFPIDRYHSLAHREVKPMGGRRKAAALRRFARTHRQFPEQVVVVGDSITDARMLETVDRAGGLAIAFNANEYSLPYATVGLASTNISDLKILLDAWEKGGRMAVEQAVTGQGGKGKGEEPIFHWLEGVSDLEEPLQIHQRIRRLVRQEAGKPE